MITFLKGIISNHTFCTPRMIRLARREPRDYTNTGGRTVGDALHCRKSAIGCCRLTDYYFFETVVLIINSIGNILYCVWRV